jgi:hypothetical protein
MFKTADEDVLSAKKYLWLRGVFNFRHLTPWRHNNKALYRTKLPYSIPVPT